jgi:hypothetical protein
MYPAVLALLAMRDLSDGGSLSLKLFIMVAAWSGQKLTAEQPLQVASKAFIIVTALVFLFCVCNIQLVLGNILHHPPLSPKSKFSLFLQKNI